MPRKPSFDIFLAIEMFKAGKSYNEIAKELHIKNGDTVRKTIKRHAAELLDNPLNKYEVIDLFKRGLNYKQISEKLNVTDDAVKKVIERNALGLIELKKKRIIDLYKSGMTYKEIVQLDDVNVTEDAIRKLVGKYSPEELDKRRLERAAKKVDKQLFEPTEEELNLKVAGALTIDDRKELLNEKRWGINTNEGLSNYAFFQWNRPSYISDKNDNRKFRFDKRCGSIQKDLKTLNL